mmetsp:Transcript_36680/g.67241  ORF Transcript_36680/g.67241 Transcript_36680/m.67241 type:complete len:205 (-) Transcript_36680:25-639(-)
MAKPKPGRQKKRKNEEEAEDSNDSDAEQQAAEGEESATVSAPLEGQAGWKGFCTAVGSMLARTLESPEAPVLSETKVEESLNKEQLEAKGKRAAAQAQKRSKEPGRTVPDITQKAFEAELRSLATKGVVRLFNTVQEFQSRANENETEEKLQIKGTPLDKRGKRIAQRKQDKFQEIWNQKRAKTGSSQDVSRSAADAGLEEFEV